MAATRPRSITFRLHQGGRPHRVADADRRDGRREPKPATADAALTATERDELARLRRENRQLRLERDILSQAAAWFAQETGVVPPGSSHS